MLSWPASPEFEKYQLWAVCVCELLLEQSSRTSPWNELCSTKSGSAKLQKKISFIHLLVSHSRPTYWISIRISFVLFWKLLNHSAANTNLAFQSINCCYFCCYWSLLDRVLVLRSKSVYWCFSLLSILMFFQHLIWMTWLWDGFGTNPDVCILSCRSDLKINVGGNSQPAQSWIFDGTTTIFWSV